MRCMKVVFPEPAIPMQTTATGGLEPEGSGVDVEAIMEKLNVED